jgi:hypothetical protein
MYQESFFVEHQSTLSMLYLGYFEMGKVNTIEGNLLNITLFQYKLDVKSKEISEEDSMLNFGNIGNKSIF